MTHLKLALDWTPNINHIGFLIAKELGFYENRGVELELIDPLADNYSTTPGKKLELGMVDFAIAPFETVVSLNNKKNAVPVKAIYTILQEDLSCIATLKSSKITSPKGLDGKIYASYKARYEDHIVREMVTNDGGAGDLNIIYPEKLGIWNTLLKKKADATWIFDNWEGVEARSKGIELNSFAMADYGIPYGYSPIVLAHTDKIGSQQEAYSGFVQGTRAGFLHVKDHPDESKKILSKYLPREDLKNIDLDRSISFTAPYFGDEDSCGKMQDKRVGHFLQWLTNRGLEHKGILDQDLFTNELF